MFPEFTILSPNCDPRAGAHERRGVCFHHTEMSFGETIAHMSDSKSRVSYHTVIARDGTRCVLVPDDQIAWHAGVSTFQGRDHCNAFLLGVSFEGDTRRDPLTLAQMASALEWLEPRWLRHGWTLADLTDHRQIAPTRKRDLEPAEFARLLRAISQLNLPQPGPRP